MKISSTNENHLLVLAWHTVATWMGQTLAEFESRIPTFVPVNLLRLEAHEAVVSVDEFQKTALLLLVTT